MTSLSSSASQAFPIPSVSASSCPLLGCRGQLSYIDIKNKNYFTPNFFTYLSMSHVKKNIYIFFHIVHVHVHMYSKTWLLQSARGSLLKVNALYHNWSLYNTTLRHGKWNWLQCEFKFIIIICTLSLCYCNLIHYRFTLLLRTRKPQGGDTVLIWVVPTQVTISCPPIVTLQQYT